MDATLQALRESIEAVTSLEESIHREPPGNPHMLRAQVTKLSNSLMRVHGSCRSVDDALEVPVKLELVSVVDEHRLGPDVYKKKMMEENEAILRATAERVIFLKELQVKVAEKAADSEQCKHVK